MRGINDKRGAMTSLEKGIGIIVIILLVANLAPIALSPLFQTQNLTIGANASGTYNVPTGVPAWVPIVLGILGVVGFIFFMWRLNSKK